MVYNNNRVISTDKKSESSSTGSNSTTTGKMCSANTPIVPYNLRKHATTTATTTMASAIVASAPRRTTTRTVAATTASKPPVSAATKTATTKPTTVTKPTTNSTNKPVTTRSNKPSTTSSSSSSSAAIKKLCFERQSTLISSSVDNDTTVVNDITVVEKKIDDKKKKKRASPLTLASSKLSGYEEEDDDDDDDDVEEIKKEFKQPPKPQPGKNTARKAPPNKKLRKLRLCDTPHTPKTLMKKSSFDLLTPKTSTNDRVVSPVAASSVFGEKLTKSTISVPLRMKPLSSQHVSDAAAKLSAVKQALTANFVDDVEMILMETTVGDEDGLRRREVQPTKTPARPPRYQSRFTPKNLQPKQALTFDDSDNESSSSTNSITVSSSAQTTTTNREAMNFMSSDEMTLKRLRVTSESSSNGAGIFSHQRQSSLQSMFNVMKTPAPTSSSAIHASINPFTPPGGGAASTTSSREVSLVRVAAANYSAVKQKASSLAALSTTTASTEVESARMPIRKCLVSRYHQEFHEVCKLGSGEFGDVFKCINRLDGCTYAIKRSKLAIAGSALEVAAWKEVCAHAVLVKHNHIVQYYSAWAEMDRMLIQNEYCNGGSLAEFLDTLRLSNMHTTNTATSAGLLSLPPSPSPSCSSSTSSNPSSTIMSECDLKTLLLHVAKGLSYMHSLHLAHLDIKPGNIFICRSPRRQQMHSSLHQSSMKGVGSSLTSTTTTTTTMEGLVGTSSSTALLVSNEESGIESDDLDESETESTTSSVLSSSSSVFSDIITYKIGDLGHVTSTLHENPHVEEGDCRYLPNEILQENYSWLVKADVFALALTVFVAGSLEDLPKNGDEWHWIRQGNLKDLPQCSDRFKKLLQQMIHEEPSQRPSASTLVHHPCICPDSTKSKAQLRKELNQEKFKNEMLQRKVKKYEEQIHKLDSPLNPVALLGSNRCLNPIDSEQSKSNPKLARSLSSTLL